MSKYQSRIDRNQSLNCSLPDCFKRRHGLSKYCSSHTIKLNLYGHPLGVALPKQVYNRESGEVKDFVLRHSEHKAVRAALTFFETWLKDACSGAGQEEFKKLYEHGITASDCLEAFLSVWLYSHRNYSKLPDDIRLSYQLAIGLFSLRNKEKVKASVKKDVGKRLRESLGVFALNAITAIEREAEIQETLRNNLLTPFKAEDKEIL